MNIMAPRCGLLAGPDPLVTLDLACYAVANVAIRAWRDQAAATRLGDLARLSGDATAD